MKEYFSISQTAKMVDITTETLRHYDRIGLVKPCKKDEWTKYRYYSQAEVVKLNIIRALRYMDLTLYEIKKILEYEDFNKIIAVLKQAEKNAEDKIAELISAKEKIRRARTFYEGKSNCERQEGDIFVKKFPQRIILLSATFTNPSLDNLWDYHSHFYSQLPQEIKNEFYFEDLAGVYEQNGRSHLFAVCTKYTETNGLRILPQGNYLCANCTEDDREQVLERMLKTAKEQYNIVPDFTVRLVVLSGILQWNYQTQIFLG